MKYVERLVLMVAVCLCVVGCTRQGGCGGEGLRVGDSLDGWGCYLADADAEVSDVWRIADGVLVCRGICLTSEGDEIHFRNVVVTAIPPAVLSGNVRR